MTPFEQALAQALAAPRDPRPPTRAPYREQRYDANGEPLCRHLNCPNYAPEGRECSACWAENGGDQ